MRAFRQALIACAIALPASFILARTHPFGDPGLDTPKPDTQKPAQALMDNSSVPADVRALLATKCADCHSMQTRLPAYDRVALRFAPASWLIERDIVEGRSHMNLSLWDTWTPDQQQIFAAKILEESKTGKMPPPQYRVIHRNAGVTDADVAIFSRWTREKIAPQPVGAAEVLPGDPARGREIFEKRCSGCHALNQNREGPRLRDVFGRTSGQIAGFLYSPALVKAHIVWNQESLEQWLTDPDALVPGNNMDFHVPKAQERQDLIRFLKEQNANQAPGAP
jgi:cytochrome c